MKKSMFILLTLCLITFSNTFAQENTKPIGCASCVSAYQATSTYAWGIGLVSLAIMLTAIGFIATNSTKSPDAFSSK